ncbi:MAG: hypothetical protein HY327_11510 [Chloroflexi bacterium]|nr:hypothetical protein [Chloroflexota bacterium]
MKASHSALPQRPSFRARAAIGVLLIGFVATTACESGRAATPTPTQSFASPVISSPSPSPTSLPTGTATITPTPIPLRFFPGFVDTGCVFGVPNLQLLNCLAQFTGAPLRLAQGALTATQGSFKDADGKDYAVNALDLGGLKVRNIQGTTYWDLAGLTPTPAATRTLVPTSTPTPVPQLTIGSLRFYDFDPDELQFISEAFQWVNDMDRDAWRLATSENLSVYRVEPDFLSAIAALAGMSISRAQPDMLVPYTADRVQIRSDYMRAMLARLKASTVESNFISFVALLGRHARRAHEFRAYRATGKPLNTCADFNYAQEKIFEAAGFRTQGEIVQKAANGALEKGRVGINDRNRDEKIRTFRTETGAWVQELATAAQSPEVHSAPCYPPTPTPTFTPAPPKPTPTLAVGMGALIVFNPYSDATFTINGPAYSISAGGEVVVTLAQGRYTYTASFPGKGSVTGNVEVQAGRYNRFILPPPPEREPPTRAP